MTANIVVDTESLDRAAGMLRDIAADMRIGQFDSFLVDRAGCPDELARAMRAFAEFAHERYRDTAAFASQLSMLVGLAAANYRHHDLEIAEATMRPLAGFVPRPAGS